MARYSDAFTKTTGASAGLIAQLRAANTGRPLVLFEVGLFASTAVSENFQLIRPSAVGATFTSTTGVAEDDLSGVATGVVDTVVGTPPTIASIIPMRQIILPASIGAGMIWTFPKGIRIAAATSIVLWQISTAAVGLAGYFVWEE